MGYSALVAALCEVLVVRPASKPQALALDAYVVICRTPLCAQTCTRSVRPSPFTSAGSSCCCAAAGMERVPWQATNDAPLERYTVAAGVAAALSATRSPRPSPSTSIGTAVVPFGNASFG